MSPIEVDNSRQRRSAIGGAARSASARTIGTVPGGPDVIVGDLPSMRNLVQAMEPRSASGWERRPAINGNVDLDWFALPNTDHPVIPQNLYRMSGGASNNDRFEQIGQSWFKHAFTALTENVCGFGCNGARRHSSWGGMLRSVLRELECESKWPGFTRLGQSLHRRLSRRPQPATPATRTQARRTGFWWR